MGLWGKSGVGFAVLAVGVFASYVTVPTRNTDAGHFDTLIVLGWPANDDGTPAPEQRERVLEAVRELRAGRAEHMIVTGGAAHNHWVEAEVMAKLARAQGVPDEVIVVEGQARNTIQNVFYSDRIMAQRGWKSAEVISSGSHLPRASLILVRYRFAWSTHAALWPREYGTGVVAAHYVYEALATTRVRWFGFPTSEFMPERH